MKISKTLRKENVPFQIDIFKISPIEMKLSQIISRNYKTLFFIINRKISMNNLIILGSELPIAYKMLLCELERSTHSG